MGNRLVLGGFDELRDQLRRLPGELAHEGAEIVDDGAELAHAQIFQGYPRRTGKLRERLTIERRERGPYGIAVRLVSASPHAWMFENGTQARHTALGANRGAMPPGKVFIPAMIRHRRAIGEGLRALVQRAGLVVTGDE